MSTTSARPRTNANAPTITIPAPTPAPAPAQSSINGRQAQVKLKEQAYKHQHGVPPSASAPAQKQQEEWWEGGSDSETDTGFDEEEYNVAQLNLGAESPALDGSSVSGSFVDLRMAEKVPQPHTAPPFGLGGMKRRSSSSWRSSSSTSSSNTPTPKPTPLVKDKDKDKDAIRRRELADRDCGICFEYAVHPIRTLCCRKLFCKEHITDWLLGPSSDGHCPACLKPCSLPGFTSTTLNAKADADLKAQSSTGRRGQLMLPLSAPAMLGGVGGHPRSPLGTAPPFSPPTPSSSPATSSSSPAISSSSSAGTSVSSDDSSDDTVLSPSCSSKGKGTKKSKSLWDLLPSFSLPSASSSPPSGSSASPSTKHDQQATPAAHTLLPLLPPDARPHPETLLEALSRLASIVGLTLVLYVLFVRGSGAGAGGGVEVVGSGL